MVDVTAGLAGIKGMAGSMASSWITWLLLGVLTIGVIFGGLLMRKKGKLRFPTVVIQDTGNGKVNIVSTKAGWFKSFKLLGGLYDYKGERRLEIADGRIVQKGGSADFHEINYRTGLILVEKEDDPKILLPVDRMKLDKESQDLIAKIAPADYRDASSKIIADSEKETSNSWEQIAQILLWGFMGVILFVSIILVIQYSKGQMMAADALYEKAQAFYQNTIGKASTVPSNAP